MLLLNLSARQVIWRTAARVKGSPLGAPTSGWGQPDTAGASRDISIRGTGQRPHLSLSLEDPEDPVRSEMSKQDFLLCLLTDCCWMSPKQQNQDLSRPRTRRVWQSGSKSRRTGAHWWAVLSPSPTGHHVCRAAHTNIDLQSGER